MLVSSFLTLFFVTASQVITASTRSIEAGNIVANPGCTWELVAAPKIIVPGQESIVFVSPKGCNFTQSTEDLMATLSIWDTTHHKVIHGMVWQVEPDRFKLDDPQSVIGEDVSILPPLSPRVVTIPLRVPASLPPSQGVLRLHSKCSCHPFVEKHIEDKKCPENCTKGNCIAIPFQLASSIRQILLITDRTHYHPGQTVRIRYQVLDESTMPRHPAELSVTIGDASGTLLHTWNLGYLQRTARDLEMFEEITFPLGPRALKGQWMICAPDIIDEDKTQNYCIKFYVTGGKDDDYDTKDAVIVAQEENTTGLLEIESQISQEHFINLTFEAPATYRTGVPFAGKVLTASSEDEVEVLVKLLQQKDNDSVLLDQQTVLITSQDTNEAIFNFAAVATNADKLTIEAFWIKPDNTDETDVEDLEIDEVKLTASDKSLLLLASTEIQRESESPERYNCPIWTMGLERTFKTGDFAAVTVKASPACGCQRDLELNWVLMRNDQYVSWGQQFPEENEKHECVYRFGLEITSRMAPQATFKAFRPIYNDDIYTYDMQNIAVDLEDRTLVILELNTTEVSHSSSLVGVEVFAEPESTICLRGRKTETSTSEKKKKGNIAAEDTAVKETPSISDSSMELQMIKAFGPVSRTWFFQCGRASEDGFYATWIKAPLEGGQWSVEAVSLSPFHGMRMAQPQPLLRTKPIHLRIEGIPTTMRRGEILANFTLMARNNMPISLQLTVIVSASQGIQFESTGSHFETYQLNASAYESNLNQISMHITNGASLGPKTISFLVTAVAFVEGKFVEVDAVHMTKELLVLPRGHQHTVSQLDYFCSTISASSKPGMLADSSPMIDGHQVHLDPKQQTGINFTIKSRDEAILLIEDEVEAVKFKVGIGASGNSVTWLSRIKGRKRRSGQKGGGATEDEYEIRLDTQNTPQILSPAEERHFWLDWKLDHAHVAQLQLGRGGKGGHGGHGSLNGEDEEVILKWPIPVTFAPTKISALTMPQANVEIRFWHGQQLSDFASAEVVGPGATAEAGAEDVNSNYAGEGKNMVEEATHKATEKAFGEGGHNRIFHTMGANNSLNGTTKTQIILSDGFNLPLKLDAAAKDRMAATGTFQRLMDTMRDAATLSLLERLQRLPKGQFTSKLIDKMHIVAQDLMYFRNVDGSFGDPLTQQTFGQAMEQLYLMSEIENFYPLSAFLRTGLENWIIHHKSPNTMDVLQWAPRDSKVFEKMGGQGYSDTLEAILYLRDEIGPMGLLTTPTFTRSLALLSLGSNGTSLVEDWLNLYLRNSLGNNFRDCQRSRYSDLVYVLWTMANLLPSRPVVPGERRWSSSFEDIFECVHSHSKEILSSTEVGYTVIRALESAHQAKSLVQSSKNLSNPGERQDLKISFATSEDLGHSKTWRMKSAGTSDNTKNNGRDQEQGDVDDDYENEPIVSHSIQHVWLEHPIPDKLFFLATGEGCGTAEVQTVYETFSVENADSIYMASLEASLETDTTLFITLCIRLKEGSLNRVESSATTILLEMFSGFEYVSHSTNMDSKPNFWYISQTVNSGLILHVNKVSSDTCGTCITLQFRRDTLVNSLAPAKLTVYPSMASPEAKEAYKQFFHINSLNSSIDAEETAAWRKSSAASDADFSNDNGIQAADPMPKICPCSFRCESTTTLDSTLPPSSTSPPSPTSKTTTGSATSPTPTTTHTSTSIIATTQSTTLLDEQRPPHLTSASASNNSLPTHESLHESRSSNITAEAT